MIPGIDVSKWEPNIDWQKVKSAGYSFVYIKASQGLSADPSFADHWANAKAAGVLRGAYHYYEGIYQSQSPKAQAEKFVATLGGDLGELPLAVDIEGWTAGVYHGATYWYDFLERLKQLAGDHPIAIYTAYYYWLDNVKIKPVLDLNYFAKYPLWVANYNVASPLVPAPWKTWKFWQTADNKLVDGVLDPLGRPTEVDIDRYNGTAEQFEQEFGASAPDPVIHTQPYAGVDRYRLNVNGVNVVVEVTDLAGKRVRVVYHPWLKTVSQFAVENGAQMGWNANPWDVHQVGGPWVPQGVCVSEGGTISNDRSGVPTLNISRDGNISIQEGSLVGLYNAVSGFRMLVRDGVNVIPTNDPDVKYTELHARSGKGMTADRKLITVTSEGVYPGSGLTLHQLAEVFVRFGAVSAFDNDSGGSSTDYDASGAQITFDRPVVCALLVYAEGATMARYEATAIADETRLRTDHNTSVSYTASYPRGTKFHGDTLWVCPADVRDVGGNVIQRAGDTWLNVSDVSGIAKPGWVAISHLGLPICTLVDMQPTTPPTPEDDKIEIYVNGTLKYTVTGKLTIS